MPSVQQQKTLVLKRPVLFAEQINPVLLPSVVLHDQGCRRQKLPVQSNTKVLDRWWWWWTDTSLRYRHWRMCFERLLQAFARWQPGISFDIGAQPILEYRWIDSYSQQSLTVDGMVHQNTEFEIYSLWNWQPMQFVQSQWHVVTWFQVHDQSSSSVENSLKWS